MPAIKLKNISKYICQNVNLEVLDKELLVLLGPNGAGKSTLLNVIAGLIKYEGSISFENTPVDKLPASGRKIGYLFQDLYLFPHLSVFSNIAYSLKVKKKAPEEIKIRVEKLLQMLRIENLSYRYPGELSGGEKQRTALARALALEPEVLLLDEPLSSLDVQSSKYLRRELKQLQKKLGITTIYVTHNLTEAEEMADRIAIIEKGNIEQIAKTELIFFYPENKKVSEFIGAPNILDCNNYHSLGNGITEVSCGGLPVIIPDEGEKVKKIALLPRDIYISEIKPPGPNVNRFKGVITDINIANEAVRLKVKAEKNNLLAELPHHIFERMNLNIGKEIFLIFKLRKIKCL
ncbi:MAG: ABC transporter ATP-binding protein [Candidatus Caldatribacteriota bacterium]|nr:ABC transporter ATP-binding protein [Candidatus Caldatribacteriota bacterium]